MGHRPCRNPDPRERADEDVLRGSLTAARNIEVTTMDTKDTKAFGYRPIVSIVSFVVSAAYAQRKWKPL